MGSRDPKDQIKNRKKKQCNTHHENICNGIMTPSLIPRNPPRSVRCTHMFSSDEVVPVLVF